MVVTLALRDPDRQAAGADQRTSRVSILIIPVTRLP